jgi:sugar (glycoside-pentoside-hexuronide) transporter
MEKLKNREIWGYAFGNLAQNMIYLLVSVYLLYFYTDVFGITAAAASLLFLLMRIFDAVNDPMMGFLADKTHTRWGKFRPYVLFGSIPLAIITVLLFTTPNLGPTGKLVWAYLTYLFYGVIFTVVLIPYFAMPAVMTQDPNERSKISTVNIVLSTISALIISVAVTPLVGLFPSEQIGFPVVTAGCVLIAVAAFYICFRSTTERVVQKSETQYRFRDVFRLLAKNTPLILVSVGYIFYSIQYTVRMAAVAYYAKYYLNNENMTMIILLIAVAFGLLGTGVALPMMKKWGKKTAYLIGAAIGIVGCSAMYFVPKENITLILILLGLGQAGSSIPLVATWSMAPDTVDYCEWKTGIRAEGTTFGAFSFVQKLASAIAGALSAAILAATGYIANTVQTQAALNGINSMMTLIPAACCVICIVIMAFYNLDAKKMETILATLQSGKSE